MPKARSYGTGTIIDARSGEALVDHLRPLVPRIQGQGAGERRAVRSGPERRSRRRDRCTGKVISYDLERDVAFVSIRPTRPGVRRAGRAAAHADRARRSRGQRRLQQRPGSDRPGDADHVARPLPRAAEHRSQRRAGRRPQRRRIVQRQGQLVGVCFAADYEGNEGLYAGLESIHDELDRLGLQGNLRQAG